MFSGDRFRSPRPGWDRYEGFTSRLHRDEPYDLGFRYDSRFWVRCPDESDFDVEPNADNCLVEMELEDDYNDEEMNCRSVSIVPTDPSDGIFQLQFDCSNFFDRPTYTGPYQPCAGRDRHGNCFDIYSVPNPSSNPVVTGSFSDFTCQSFSFLESEPEPYGGKHWCYPSSIFSSRQMGFPYTDTESSVSLYCDDPNVISQACDCLVKIGFPPARSTSCNECTIIPSGDDATYQISFDCSNFYHVGDCVGVDENGDCVRSSEAPIEWEGSCEGDPVVMPCSNLFSRESCPRRMLACIDDRMDTCEEDCGRMFGCDCITGFATGQNIFIECSGTTGIFCSDFATPSLCESNGCNWMFPPTPSPTQYCPPLEIATPIASYPDGLSIVGTNTESENPRFGSDDFQTGWKPVWYTFTADTAASFVATTCSSLTTDFRALVNVYRADPQGDMGCDLEFVGKGLNDRTCRYINAALDVITCNFCVFFDTSPGDTYYVAVSGISREEGIFELELLSPFHPPCHVCPDDDDVRNGGALVPIMDELCFRLQDMGRLGLIAEDDCRMVQTEVPLICGCGSLPPTPAPTSSPTPKPTPRPTSPPTTRPTPPPTPEPIPPPTPEPTEPPCFLNFVPLIPYDRRGIIASGTTLGLAGLLFPSSSGLCDEDTDNSLTVWFRFEAEEDGRVLLTTCPGISTGGDTEFDTLITVFEGDPDEADCDLDCVEENDDHEDFDDWFFPYCDDDDHSALVFEADEGETYYIALSGSDNGEGGEFILAVLPLNF